MYFDSIKNKSNEWTLSEPKVAVLDLDDSHS